MDSNRDIHGRRPSLSEIWGSRDSRIFIDDSGMAPRLQPTALRLNRRLSGRKSRDELVSNGYLPMDVKHKNLLCFGFVREYCTKNNIDLLPTDIMKYVDKFFCSVIIPHDT